MLCGTTAARLAQYVIAAAMRYCNIAYALQHVYKGPIKPRRRGRAGLAASKTLAFFLTAKLDAMYLDTHTQWTKTQNSVSRIRAS